MRISLLPMFLLVFVLAISGTSLAFDCAAPSEKESFQRAELVFEGEVIRTHQVNERPAYTFKVHQLLKGSAASEVTIITNYSSCGAHFLPDIVYRVYASRFQGQLMTGACSGNRVIKAKKH
jgi:hypothetical protein